VEPTSVIPKLQQRLDERAEAKTKAWWEKYLKGVIPFRGVKMAGTRAELHDWIRDEEIVLHFSADEQKALALRLIQESYAEDKLAGILYLQEVLLPAGQIDCADDLPRFARLFQEEAIYDWNTCDWFCVGVLGPLAKREGEGCARAIAGWRTAGNLWQRRAAGVAFVNLAKDGDDNFPGFSDMLLEVCESTVRHPERFAQTGTGWVLRELGRAEPARVVAFIEANLANFSSEGLRYATEKMPAETKVRLKEMHRAQGR
jgi:3-methyladenine DNA glycosylase AlkD